MLRFSSLLALTALAAAPAAQVPIATVAPPGYETAEGNATMAIPFGVAGPKRLQVIYHGRAVNVRFARKISFRGRPGVTHPGSRVELEIIAGGAAVDPFSMQQIYANNRGPDAQTVFDRQWVSLPALTGTQTPQPFDVEIPLSRPLSRTSSPHLLVEFIVHDADPGAAGYDVDGATFGPQSLAPTGTDCGSAWLAPSGIVQTAPAPMVLNMRSNGYTFGNGFGLALLGTGPLPMSVPLPGGNCLIHQDIAAFVPVALDAAGSSTLNLPLPPWFKRAELQLQFVAADASLTTTASSTSWRLTIGGAEAAASNISNVFAAPGGSVRKGLAPILRFE